MMRIREVLFQLFTRANWPSEEFFNHCPNFCRLIFCRMWFFKVDYFFFKTVKFEFIASGTDTIQSSPFGSI